MGHRRALGIGLRKSPRGGQFLMSEVPLHAVLAGSCIFQMRAFGSSKNLKDIKDEKGLARESDPVCTGVPRS